MNLGIGLAITVNRKVQGSAFVPSGVPGLHAWYRTSTLSEAEGATVATLPDLSGGGRDLTQPTEALKPTIATIGGVKTLRFQPSRALSSAAGAFSGLTAAEVFYSFKIDVDPPAAAGDCGFWEFGTDVGAPDFMPFTDTGLYCGWGSTARKALGAPPLPLTTRRVLNITSIAGEYTARLNGTQFFTTAVNIVAFASICVLGGNPAAGIYMNGHIWEMAIYNRKLSTAERAQVHTYFGV